MATIIKWWIAIYANTVVLVGLGLADQTKVDSDPFEPTAIPCVNLYNKFDHPEEVVRFAFRYPKQLVESRSVNAGEVVVLIVVDESGHPTRLSVLSATSRIYEDAAIDDLLKTV